MERSDIIAEDLIAAGIAARERAYAPYSNYKVGAAILTEDGRVFTGCNVENAAYSLTLCAERVAVVKAISEGARAIAAVAVATENGGPPCGSCRQVIQEFSAPDTPVFIARLDGHYHEHTIVQLLPESFSIEDLSVST
ncbi:MAG: cytidine deaminase [Anaerolineales bacterium]